MRIHPVQGQHGQGDHHRDDGNGLHPPGGVVMSPGGEQVRGKDEPETGNAVAVKQRVEDRRRSQRLADDERIPDQAQHIGDRGKGGQISQRRLRIAPVNEGESGHQKAERNRQGGFLQGETGGKSECRKGADQPGGNATAVPFRQPGIAFQPVSNNEEHDADCQCQTGEAPGHLPALDPQIGDRQQAQRAQRRAAGKVCPGRGTPGTDGRQRGHEQGRAGAV